MSLAATEDYDGFESIAEEDTELFDELEQVFDLRIALHGHPSAPSPGFLPVNDESADKTIARRSFDDQDHHGTEAANLELSGADDSVGTRLAHVTTKPLSVKKGAFLSTANTSSVNLIVQITKNTPPSSCVDF